MESVQVNPQQSSQTTSTFYVWEVPGKPIIVHLDFSVVDRLLMEVMRGFGAIPRRGAEVGGVLIGHVEPGEKTIVHVQEFEPVNCEHRRGPSYLLSDTDLSLYEEIIIRNKYSPEKRLYAVGCYRSHTREGMSLDAEDLQHFDTFLPDPSSLFLLVKPFATRVSMAGIFFRENGQVNTHASYQEFPFRRRELGGGAAPAGKAREVNNTPPPPQTSHTYSAKADLHINTDDFRFQEVSDEQADYGTPADTGGNQLDTETTQRTFRRTNVWIPLSFIFLLLGVLVGFQAALTYRPAKAAGMLNDVYGLSLSASRNGDYLMVRWDRHAPAIRLAQRGVLTITEGTFDKKVDLDVLQLQNPTVYYRNMSDEVRFRLEIYTKERISVSEVLEWRK